MIRDTEKIGGIYNSCIKPDMVAHTLIPAFERLRQAEKKERKEYKYSITHDINQSPSHLMVFSRIWVAFETPKMAHS